MLSKLMVSVSGVRGVVGEALTPLVIVKYVVAFCNLLRKKIGATNTRNGPTVVLGRDSRVSGPWMELIVKGCFQSQGYNVISLGIVPTPTVQFMVQQEKAIAGIVVTSSHNPVNWNGLKFIDSDGLFLSPELCDELFKLAENEKEFVHPNFDTLGIIKEIQNAASRHIDAILGLEYINVDSIKSRRFKICLDTVNGAGGPIMMELLARLGAHIIPLNTETTGRFAHEPEPLPSHLSQLCQSVKENKADLGIAVDPDVDRCVLIDENGNPIGEEYTLAIAVDFILGHCNKRGPVCKNLSTSRVIDEIAEKYHCPVYDTPVGEIHVAKQMVAVKAVIGGEGNGGVMLPDVHIGRDAPVATALILQRLAIHKGSLRDLVNSLPQWFIVKLKIGIEGINIDNALDVIKREWVTQGAKVNTSDGLRIDTKEWWVHLRKSNTEPVVRVIGEAQSEQKANEICKQFMHKIRDFK
jgi:phosphomannomutase